MKWKQFKKERIFLNYTVMLLPHSQKKPIHFKTPVWTFGLIFLGLLGEYILSINARVMNRPLVIEEERINFEQASGVNK